jgi:hypothetical protein
MLVGSCCGHGTYRAVQNPVVCLFGDDHLDVGSITAGNVGLSHQESRSDLSLQQRIHPLPLLCLSSVLGQHFHVASIGSSAVGSLRGQMAFSQGLGHETVLQVGETSTLLEVVRWQEHVPEPELLSLQLKVFHYVWVGAEALLGGGAELLLVNRLNGNALILDESLKLRKVRLNFQGQAIKLTISSVFLARSDTKWRTTGGMRSLAVGLRFFDALAGAIVNV